MTPETEQRIREIERLNRPGVSQVDILLCELKAAHEQLEKWEDIGPALQAEKQERKEIRNAALEEAAQLALSDEYAIAAAIRSLKED